MKTVIHDLMLKVRYQKILLVLLMLVFGGQSMASAYASCQNQVASPQSNEEAMDFDTMDHSQHLGLNSSADGPISTDCCLDCDCSLAGCSASAALPTTLYLFSSGLAGQNSRYQQLLNNQLAVSLFRPPISR